MDERVRVLPEARVAEPGEAHPLRSRDPSRQRRKSTQALALRSRIVLGCAEGLDNKRVAAREGVTPQTVGKWRARFVELRLDGLEDDPRPGRPPSITVEHVEDVVVATLCSGPEERHNTDHRRVRASVEHTFAAMKTDEILRDRRRRGHGVYWATTGVAHLRNLALTG